MRWSALPGCLWVCLQSVATGQESPVYALELGRADGRPGDDVEIPLHLSAGGDVYGVQAVFDWDGTAGTGADLVVDPGVAEAAEFVDFHVAEDWMALGIVTFSSPLAGDRIPLARAVIRCGTEEIGTVTQVVFRDGVHRVDLLLSNALTVDCSVDCRSLRREGGLALRAGSFRCVAPPCPVDDVVCTPADGVVEVSWSLRADAGCRSQAIKVRAGNLTRLLPAGATSTSIACEDLASSGTISVLSLGSDGTERRADCSYVCGMFSRGDGNDDGKVDVSDAVTVLSCLFRGLFCPGCLDAADCNDDGRIDTSDAVCVLSCVFGLGICPAEPFPGCGADATGDALECGQYESCS